MIFSDAPSSIAEATATVDTRAYVYVSGRSVFNAATVTVLDQYGAPIPGSKVKLDTTLTTSSLVTDQEFSVDSRGSHRFSYEYTGPGGEIETLTPLYGTGSATRTGSDATVYWAVDAGRSGVGNVVAGDVHRNQVVVTDADIPVMLVYDDNDRFNVRGSPVALSVFEAELADVLRRGDQPLLTWSRYQAGRDDPVAEYSLG